MAVFSALKNKKNQKMREGIEDLALKCSESSDKDDLNIQVDLLVKEFEQLNINLSEKELTKIQKISDSSGKVSKEDFVTFAKSCGSVKDYLEKTAREQSRVSGQGGSARPLVVSGKQDQASTAFRAIDKDNSGFVDREEFLQFTSNLPKNKQEKLLKKIDKDGDGKISLEEFRQLFEKH